MAKQRHRIGLAVIVGVALAFLVGGLLLVDIAPTEARLPTLTSGLRARIVRYARETGRPPESLAALALADPPAAQFVTDPWGADFQYAFSPEGVVTLTSLSGRASIAQAAKDEVLRVWRFQLTDAEETWIGNDGWGRQTTAITQNK